MCCISKVESFPSNFDCVKEREIRSASEKYRDVKSSDAMFSPDNVSTDHRCNIKSSTLSRFNRAA